MAKIVRKKQILFASAAPSDQISGFGSLAFSDPTYTTDPTVIQSFAFSTGWFEAVAGLNNPCIEDENALAYLWAYQLSYVFQAGIPEWEIGTTYYTGSLCQVSGIVYVSLVDSNINHNPASDTTNWFTPTQNGTVTPNTIPNSMTLPTGKVLSWPTPTIGSGITITVPSGARLSSEGPIVVSGTGSLIVTGTGVARSF